MTVQLGTDLQGLEQYRLVEKMGDGAFSNVYKAIDRKTGQKVAVKVVRKYELNSTQVRTVSPTSFLPFFSSPSSPMPWPGMGSRWRIGLLICSIHLRRLYKGADATAPPAFAIVD
jgi:serine/threonine protein kinase